MPPKSSEEGFRPVYPDTVKTGDRIALHGTVASIEKAPHKVWDTLYLFRMADGRLLAYPERHVVTLLK
jgi:hypothetical protein